MKILITGAKSSVALKLLKAFNSHQLVLADYGEVPSFAIQQYQLISLGIKNEDILAHNLLNYCLNEGVTSVLPIYNFEIEALAKAEVLFSEFDIDLLLPHVSVLDQYFTAGQNNKSEHWAVFKAGELIYSTSNEHVVAGLGRDKNLNGAFYLSNTNEFKLFTI